MIAVGRDLFAALLRECDDILDRYESGNPLQAGELARVLSALRTQLEAQRGRAVVVPEYPENSFDVRMAVQKAGGMADFDQGIFRAGWEFLASRIQPIPADQILKPGQCAIGIYEMQILRDFAARRMSQREHDQLEACRDAHEAELRAQQAKGE